MPTITTSYKGDMLFETQLGDHTLIMDSSGKRRGPVPPHVFIASLGGCITALVAQYCERAEIDTTGMTVDIDFEKAQDPTRLVDLKATIKLPNADVGPRRKAIEKVAMHCPVKATIDHMTGIDLVILDKTNA